MTPNDRMNTVLTRVLESGHDLTVSVEAARLVSRLRDEDPELLRDWLWNNAEQFVADALGTRNRSRRAHIRKVGQAMAFGKAASAADPAALAPFRIRYTIDEDNTQREVARMTGDDHLYVAQNYDMDAMTSQMLAAFHRAVARRVGSRPTEEVMDEATYLKLYASIMGDLA